MARMHGRRGFATAQRRKLTWASAQGSFAGLGVAASGELVDLLEDYKSAGGSTQGVTIMRTHVQLAVQGAAANGIEQGAFLGLIIGEVNDTFDQITSTEPFLDWMLYRRCYCFGGSEGSTNAEHIYEIDLRAKRKMQELNQLYLMNLSANVAGTVNVAYNVRTLLALP